ETVPSSLEVACPVPPVRGCQPTSPHWDPCLYGLVPPPRAVRGAVALDSGAMATSLAPLDVLLIRHAESVPVGTRSYNVDDRPLTDAGRTAAAELAYELEDYELTAIYSSPYARALETLEPLARLRGLHVHELVDLRERRLSVELHDG